MGLGVQHLSETLKNKIRNLVQTVAQIKELNSLCMLNSFRICQYYNKHGTLLEKDLKFACRSYVWKDCSL